MNMRTIFTRSLSVACVLVIVYFGYTRLVTDWIRYVDDAIDN